MKSYTFMASCFLNKCVMWKGRVEFYVTQVLEVQVYQVYEDLYSPSKHGIDNKQSAIQTKWNNYSTDKNTRSSLQIVYGKFLCRIIFYIIYWLVSKDDYSDKHFRSYMQKHTVRSSTACLGPQVFFTKKSCTFFLCAASAAHNSQTLSERKQWNIIIIIFCLGHLKCNLN